MWLVERIDACVTGKTGYQFFRKTWYTDFMMETERSLLKEYEFTSKLMGCDVFGSIVHDNETEAGMAYEASMDIGRHYECVFSRFRPDSELSRLNCTKRGNPSALFLKMFTLAQRLYRESHGVFNPLLRADLLGYDRTFSEVERVVSSHVPTYDTDFDAVVLQEETGTLILREGQVLDFGGFVKCCAAEAMARSITGVRGCIVNIGGDLFSTGSDANGKNFLFSVYNPITDAYPLALPAHNAAVATSGTYRRVWKRGDTAMHHILGSATDSARSDVVSATVVHSEGACADGYATVAVVLGSERGATFLQERGVLFALITNTGDIIHNTTI